MPAWSCTHWYRQTHLRQPINDDHPLPAVLRRVHLIHQGTRCPVNIKVVVLVGRTAVSVAVLYILADDNRVFRDYRPLGSKRLTNDGRPVNQSDDFEMYWRTGAVME